MLAAAERAADAYGTMESAVEDLEAIMVDTKSGLENKLKSLGSEISIDVSFSAFKKGISLAIGRVFGGDNANSQEVREAADAASEVIFTVPSFSGIKDRVSEVKAYMTGNVEMKIEEFKEMMEKF
ncbi:hypothetical protein N182_36460 [Sinorhizobium sp. GL2]|nr:hypothetical protein N182_36460 [Sinorhizobium sp. GL2]